MTRDMKNIYADMLTKELVTLRKRHTASYNRCVGIATRRAKANAENYANLLAQIDHELANRVASFGLFL